MDIQQLLDSPPIDATDPKFLDHLDELADAMAGAVRQICHARTNHLPAAARVYFFKRFSDVLGNPLTDRDELTLKMLDAIRTLVQGFRQT